MDSVGGEDLPSSRILLKVQDLPLRKWLSVYESVRTISRRYIIVRVYVLICIYITYVLDEVMRRHSVYRQANSPVCVNSSRTETHYYKGVLR